MITELNKKIADLATEYARLRVRYQHRGTSRNGCDCTGLIIAILQELGHLKDFILRPYKPDWNKHAGADDKIIEELRKVGEQIPNSRASIGDIAVMWMHDHPGHCGIIVAPGPVMVHSLKTEKCCKKSLLKNSDWSARWRASFRISEEKLNGT